MRKILLAALCILMMTAAACSKAPAGVEESAVFVDPNAVKAHAYGDLYFCANGFDFGIYDPIEEVTAHIEPNTTYAGQSCAFDGDDIYYFFNGFEVMANVIDGAERVTAITLTDDTVRTPDGLYIGMTEAELTEKTGKSPDSAGLHTSTDGTAQRNVTVQDGTVRAIAYVPVF